MKRLVLLALVGLFVVAVPVGAQVLNIYNWADYIGDDIIREFEREHGIRVIYNVFSNNEELHARLRAGASGYDLIFPSDYMVEVLIGEGLLQPISHDALPNLANVDEQFLDLSFDPGNRYSVPYLWGSTGIGVNTRFVREPVESWDVLWNTRYRGRIAMLNDPREVFGVALKRLGYSGNSRDLGALQEARDLLSAQKPLVLTYDSDNTKNLLVSGEVWLAHGYSGDVLMAADENPDIIYVVPKEGGLLWMDNMAIPKTARNVQAALKFIDFILRPEISARLTEEIQYPNPNHAAHEYMDEEILGNPAIYPPQEVMERMEWLEDLGEMAPVVDRLWTEVKVN